MPGTRPALPDATNGDFLLEALKEANARRAQHHVPPLVMDALLVDYAKARAAALSRREGHDGPRAGTGENLFWYEGEVMSAAADAVASWYAEPYDWDDPRPGPFSRLLWKATTSMGAARVAGQGSTAYETYIVFVFEPPDNDGEHRENVLRA
ncbi:Cysteine-rich secretory protein family protein [Nonomuraea solani]|uniref:Cysteine-rich secretory protein family protein n=1 Tax=Nonomuraea solani TaxID=1144553 RepID=A0A1H6BAQ0_9ACTN|nr:CAP domain-containing protein [Nonomuraea solani]SEG57931.1 Cysteine-rich secretory protein family protein [Nonomuraea solani]